MAYNTAAKAEAIALKEWNAVQDEIARLVAEYGDGDSRQGGHLLDRVEDRRRRALLAILRLNAPNASLEDVPLQSGRNALQERVPLRIRKPRRL